MREDPNRLHDDGWFSSSDPMAYDALLAEFRRRFPKRPEEEIVRAIFESRRLVHPAEGRDALWECAEQQIGISVKNSRR